MPVDTRNRAGSFQMDDLKDLLSQLEERLTTQISNVLKKVESLERSIESVQSNQIRLDIEISEIEQVIVT